MASRVKTWLPEQRWPSRDLEIVSLDKELRIHTLSFFSLFCWFSSLSFSFSPRTSRKRYSTPLSFIHTTLAVVFGLTFLPFTINEFVVKIPIWTQYLIVFVAIMIWCFLPLLRTKTSYVLLMYFFSYATYWKVYEADIFGIPFSSELFNRLLFISGFALWFVPFITAFKNVLLLEKLSVSCVKLITWWKAARETPCFHSRMFPKDRREEHLRSEW